MRIQHNIAALNSYRNLGGNNNAVAKNLEKLSSGYRINRAGDDAAGLAISEKMRSQIKGLETAKTNAEDGISLIQTAEGALQETHSMLNRMVELATQSANGTYTDNERAKLQSEVESLTTEMDRISKSTNFNGINLLDGSMDGTVGTVDPDGGEPTVGKDLQLQVGDTAADYQKITVSVADMSSTGLGLDKIDISKVEDADGKIGANAAIEKINAAIETVSKNRSNLGAVQNRLNHTINNLGTTTENLVAAESRVRDVDMAKEMMNYTKNNILVQASQAMLAQANQVPQGVLQLLQ